MRCPVCAYENKIDARFCVYCGAELQHESSVLHAGQLVDDGTYRIIRPLGKGGMGAVYLAANTKAFDRQCVVKEVIEYYDPTDPEEREKAIRRFEAEARTLASLKHPGIPDIYAYFSERGRNYLVMEYIEGPDLADGLTRPHDGSIVPGKAQPVENVIQYAIQICQVLDYLEHHEPPVIHNDIKPANIILDENSGRAVLVDFGTARTRYARSSADAPSAQHASVYGTVGYAAAELYEGKAEPRSDVYALAATMYHLLTDDDPRDHPFQFPRMDAIHDPLRSTLVKALANEVDERPTAAEFEKQLLLALQALYPSSASAPLPRPISFPNGKQATGRQELISLCTTHWDYAGEILYDGSIAHWLRDALHDPVAARAAEESVLRYPGDRDAGLEQFIRALDPQAIPLPHIGLPTDHLRYEAAGSEDDPGAIEIANTGAGYLYGTVKASEPWLQVPGHVRCAPGDTQSLPIAVDTSGLKPGRAYQAKVQIEASSGQSATVSIEVRVPAPAIVVRPVRVNLGTVSRKELFTGRATLEIENTGKGRADCQIEGNPPWLFLDPQRFVCPPGQTQTVDMVGRVDLLPAEGTAHKATLQINAEGERPQQVEVEVKIAGQGTRRGRLGAVLAIAFATLILLGAIAWFVFQVLQALGP
ncbi:MAG: protein kinase domain-containing protein [Anaerolineae bacterium]|jgi:serine/threonine protein kinase